MLRKTYQFHMYVCFIGSRHIYTPPKKHRQPPQVAAKLVKYLELSKITEIEAPLPKEFLMEQFIPAL